MKVNSIDYEHELQRDLEPKKNINTWNSKFGYKVLERNENKTAKTIQFSIYSNNPNQKVYIIGEFNNWGKENLEEYELKYNQGFQTITINTINHKDTYKFLIRNYTYTQILPDPASTYLDHEGNSVFWDYEDPETYHKKYETIKTNNRAVKIIQTDLPGLITHYANKENVLGHQIPIDQTYKFITTSGVIPELKKLGFNTVQFLPFAQSIDGDNWKYRYLVPFQFAIQKNWGNPDEFTEMIDEFHKHGIAVIADVVIGHIPNKDYNIFGQKSNSYGIHQWKTKHNEETYLDGDTSWGTKRPRYNDQNVQDFFISSCLHFLKHYNIDGFRIDNVDGIIRHGKNGEGEERTHGRELLRKLNTEIYNYNPQAYIHYEAHYFHEDNAKMLVAPLNSNNRALGATAYNSSRLTYFFHTTYMFKGGHEITPWKIKHIMEEKEWGKSNSTIADFHNHDAAAGLMEMRCTGAYAYDCLKSETIEGHIHSIGKLKVMEAIISFCCEGRTLDLLQTFLLQKESFEHNSSIEWFLTFNETNRAMLEFKKKVNEIMDFEEFFPNYVNNREFLNVDDKNKILVVQRKSNSHISLIIINMGSNKHYKYKVGIKEKGEYQKEFNSDEFKYNGLGLTSFKKTYQSQESTNFEVLDSEIELEEIAPYGIVVLRKEI
jgi:1,4-alpha-glucan branching enzyme